MSTAKLNVVCFLNDAKLGTALVVLKLAAANPTPPLTCQSIEPSGL